MSTPQNNKKKSDPATQVQLYIAQMFLFHLQLFRRFSDQGYR